mmetsp:Transcript_81651/g.100117  ORF Transcript_81651/g.100117 Transcript_81651/m.100117 type:complete len:344 (-) Transcript_81651:41-1072(-)
MGCTVSQIKKTAKVLKNNKNKSKNSTSNVSGLEGTKVNSNTLTINSGNNDIKYNDVPSPSNKAPSIFNYNNYESNESLYIDSTGNGSNNDNNGVTYNDIILQKTLDLYLSGNINNYIYFAKYLKQRYCYESLLFLETALVYKRCLTDMRDYFIKKNNYDNITIFPMSPINDDNDVTIDIEPEIESNNNNDDSKTNSIDLATLLDMDGDDINDFSFHIDADFKYLTELYHNIQNKLGYNYILSDTNQTGTVSQDVITELRQKALNLFKDIYNKFISEDAKFPINLPFEISMSLHDSAKNTDKLRYICDFISVFDQAMFEMWKLLSQRYLFYFEPNVKELMTYHV